MAIHRAFHRAAMLARRELLSDMSYLRGFVLRQSLTPWSGLSRQQATPGTGAGPNQPWNPPERSASPGGSEGRSPPGPLAGKNLRQLNTAPVLTMNRVARQASPARSGPHRPSAWPGGLPLRGSGFRLRGPPRSQPEVATGSDPDSEHPPAPPAGWRPRVRRWGRRDPPNGPGWRSSVPQAPVRAHRAPSGPPTCRTAAGRLGGDLVSRAGYLGGHGKTKQKTRQGSVLPLRFPFSPSK